MIIRTIKNLVLITLVLTASTAYAETIDCTAITSVPYKIIAKGVYCLTGNLSLNKIKGRAIFIAVNDVVLDLNGWTLKGTAGSATQAVGIKAYQRKNITIRNGTIRGFYIGINLTDISPFATSQGHLVEGIYADRNTFAGLDIAGLDNTVQHNRIIYTGKSSLATDHEAYGISLTGNRARAIDNEINRTSSVGTSTSYGLFFYLALNALATGNRVSVVYSETGQTYGIFFDSSAGTMAVGNQISFISGGTAAGTGIKYDVSNGKYMNNLTFNVGTPYAGGTPVGVNN